MFELQCCSGRKKSDQCMSGQPFQRKAASARGQALGSLRSLDLRDHFYSWRGASGDRYVCSVFRVAEEAIVADFSQATIIGVVGKKTSVRRPICILSSRDFETVEGRAVREEVRALGVTEWHVHFGSGDAGLRDLAASLLN